MYKGRGEMKNLDMILLGINEIKFTDEIGNI